MTDSVWFLPLIMRHFIILLLSLGGMANLAAKDKAHYVTLADIQKAGVIAKCKEVAALREENLNAKADRIWEGFKKKHPDLFTPTGRNGDAFGFVLGGKWVAALGGDLQKYVLCQESDANCRDGHHSPYENDGYMKYHVHLDMYYDDKKNPEIFEQAAHDGKFLHGIILFSTYHGIAEELLDREPNDVMGKRQCTIMESGYLAMTAAVLKMSSETYKRLEKKSGSDDSGSMQSVPAVPEVPSIPGMGR